MALHHLQIELERALDLLSFSSIFSERKVERAIRIALILLFYLRLRMENLGSRIGLHCSDRSM